MQRASFVYLFVATVEVVVAVVVAPVVAIVVAVVVVVLILAVVVVVVVVIRPSLLLPITICVFHTFAVHSDREKLHRV